MNRPSLRIALIVILWALTFLGHSWEDGIKNDAMVDSVAAKNILKTGDWKVLHYVDGYSNFYPHPPLAVWIQAIGFKIWGISDTTARLPACLFGLLTALIVFAWGRRQSLWEGTLAAFILLTSAAYLKFASDAFIDGTLTGLLYTSALLSLLATQSLHGAKAWGLASLSGLFLGLAFIAKTVFAIYVPATLAILWFLGPRSERSPLLRTLGIVLATALVAVGAWFLLGDGLNYLHHHWKEIRPRAIDRIVVEAILPTGYLLQYYWPWLIAYGLGAWGILRAWKTEKLEVRFALVLSLFIPAFLSVASHFLAHYMTIFFPAAALVGAHYLARKLKKWQQPIELGMLAILLLYATALAVFPFRLRLARSEPLRTTLLEMDRICSGQKEVLVTEGLGDKWWSLASAAWYTEHHPIFTTQIPSAKGAQILIAAPHESVDKSWSEIRLHNTTAYRLYQPSQSPLCQR